MLEKLYLNKREILKKSQKFFKNSSSLILKIGCELEFFLFEENSQKPCNQAARDDFIAELQIEIPKKFPLIYQIEKEQGASQIEVKTGFTLDLSRLCEELEGAKNFIKNLAAQKILTASFAAQPFIDDCGSALQFNISLHENDKNIFEFDENILKNVAGNLLKMTNQMMIFLAPKKEDYIRFSYEINRNLFKKGKFTAPVNLSFGADNRTCAIRVPQFPQAPFQKNNKRLEYRIAVADADSFLIIAALLLVISSDEKNYPKQIHGNAFDEQYEVAGFCMSLNEAKEFFEKENFIKEKFLEFSSVCIQNKHN
jgi:glutamine synthetase